MRIYMQFWNRNGLLIRHGEQCTRVVLRRIKDFMWTTCSDKWLLSKKAFSLTLGPNFLAHIILFIHAADLSIEVGDGPERHSCAAMRLPWFSLATWHHIKETQQGWNASQRFLNKMLLDIFILNELRLELFDQPTQLPSLRHQAVHELVEALFCLAGARIK